MLNGFRNHVARLDVYYDTLIEVVYVEAMAYDISEQAKPSQHKRLT